jgi:electron transfer flavoprotein alpha subunit
VTALVLAEHDGAQIADATRRAVSAASTFGKVTVLVAGRGCRGAADAAATIANVAEVLWSDGESLAGSLAEPVAALVAAEAPAFNALIAAATTFGKNVTPRAAALLDVAPVSEVIECVRPGVYRRPMYAGNAIATVESQERIQILTIRPSAFPPTGDGPASAPVRSVAPPPPWTRTRLVRSELARAGRPDLGAARIVVSGGRGLATSGQFAKLERIADRLGAAVGGTRAAVDAGLLSNEFQIGQTGKVIAPELYLAVGISGAIQHVAGMRDARVIAAINADENAPIFQIADYQWVADAGTALPELEIELERIGQ